MTNSARAVAFKATLPVMVGFIILGTGYGLYMHNLGFTWWYAPLMAATIFGGSVEFMIATMLTQHFNPFTVLIITFVLGFRQFFYGISMLNRYEGKGLAKFIQIFAMCDETFAVNYSLQIPNGVDRQRCYTLVSIYDYCYWVGGALLGGILGTLFAIKIPGLDFMMTALFIVLCLDQFQRESDHLSTVNGLILAVVCLVFVGQTYFLLVALMLLVAEFAVVNHYR